MQHQSPESLLHLHFRHDLGVLDTASKAVKPCVGVLDPAQTCRGWADGLQLFKAFGAQHAAALAAQSQPTQNASLNLMQVCVDVNHLHPTIFDVACLIWHV